MTLPTLTIVQTNPSGPSVVIGLGDGAAVADYGSSGWSVVNRPKWVGFTDWTGVDPIRLTVPCVFDGFREDRSVEPEIATLVSIMRPADLPRTHPPIVRAFGPLPHSDLEYVIEGIEWGNEERRFWDGQRSRAFFTLKLLQWVGVDVLIGFKATPAAAVAATVSPDSSDAATPPPSNRTYTVKSGDTLSGIAARELGSSGRWQEIADLNGIRDPRTLRVGQVLRLP